MILVLVAVVRSTRNVTEKRVKAVIFNAYLYLLGMTKFKEENGFRFIESNPESEESIVLLHGLMGGLSNFDGIIDHFSPRYNVVVPALPIFELPLRKVGLKGLTNFVEEFVEYKGYTDFHMLGNSLGGHLCILYCLRKQGLVKSMTLTGSSGLFENPMGSSWPKRENYEWVKNRVEKTFYDPAVATEDLVRDVFETVNDRNKVVRIIYAAKSALRNNIEDRLHELNIPALLVWGKDDTITPPFVGEKFHELLPNSLLVLVDNCGHAPMMEHPVLFNEHLEKFYDSL